MVTYKSVGILKQLTALMHAETDISESYKNIVSAANTALTTQQRVTLDQCKEEVAGHICVIASIVNQLAGVPAAENDWENRPITITESLGDITYTKISTDELNNTNKYNIDVEVVQQDNADAKIFADISNAVQKAQIDNPEQITNFEVISYGDGHLKLSISLSATTEDVTNFLQQVVDKTLNSVPSLKSIKYKIR